MSKQTITAGRATPPDAWEQEAAAIEADRTAVNADVVTRFAAGGTVAFDAELATFGELPGAVALRLSCRRARPALSVVEGLSADAEFQVLGADVLFAVDELDALVEALQRIIAKGRRQGRIPPASK